MTKTFTPEVGTWAWAAAAMQAGYKVRYVDWPSGEYIHLDQRLYKNHMGDRYKYEAFLQTGWELFKEPVQPVTLEPGTYLWAFAKAFKQPLCIQSAVSGARFAVTQGTLRFGGPDGDVAHLSIGELSGSWEVVE